MPTSPFAPFTNATLLFTLPSTNSTVDPITGNRVFEDGEVVTVEAKLKSVSNAKVERMPGIDPSAVYLEGHVTKVTSPTLTESIILPDGIKPSDVAAATWNEKQGNFVILFTGRSPYHVEKIIGDRLKGWFSFK
jgi:hypothetical protein